MGFITADDQNLYIQSSSGIITTLQGETGQRLWAELVGTPNRQGFPVATNDEQVLLATGMEIYSLDKQTGQFLWELRISQASFRDSGSRRETNLCGHGGRHRLTAAI